jgi:hypothetical protein
VTLKDRFLEAIRKTLCLSTKKREIVEEIPGQLSALLLRKHPKESKKSKPKKLNITDLNG